MSRLHCLRWFVLLTALSVAATACLDEDDACAFGAERCACVGGVSCDPGLTCASGLCVRAIAPVNVPANTGGSGGGGGELPPPGAAVGAACTSAEACALGNCLDSSSFPGGYCSRGCGGQLGVENDECGEGAACVQLNEASAACLDLCGGQDGACRTGYVCSPAGDRSVCQPRCRNAADCVPGSCDLSTGLCRAEMKELGGAGAACTASSQCASNACVTEAASKGIFPGGFCVRPCTAAEEDKPCPNGDGICLGLPNSAGEKTFACFPSCGTGVQCRRDYQCSLEANVAVTAGVGVCVPRCENFPSCRQGFTCDEAVGLCIRGSDAAGKPLIERKDLGSLSTNSTTLATVSVNVPDGAVSFSLIGTPMEAARLVPARIAAPNGTVLFDVRNPTQSVFRTFPFFSGSYALMYPNSPRLNLLPGSYQVSFLSTVPASVKFDVLFKQQVGVTRAGSLPVVLWFAKQKYVNAQTAQTDVRIQQALTTLRDTYRAAGIEIGAVTYQDVPGPEAESFAVIESYDQLIQLFGVADASPIQALHYFMVDHFNLTAGGTLLGISGGIPGPPAFPGLAKRGVAVALAYPERDGIALGSTMAHEGGHYLGLFHTSERDGLSFDPLIDTPECPASADTNKDKLLSVEECAGKGSDNLMFWTGSGAQRIKISNDQRFVLLRNPSLQ
ncbi:MAG TPA: hypothetical protein VGG33_29270 [Polyangia bacterium]